MAEENPLKAGIAALAASDPQYRAEAYALIFDSISYAHAHNGIAGHLSAGELVRSLQACASEAYGALAPAVLQDWGLRSPRDVGKLVYRLIGVKLLTASSEDSPADFEQLADWFPEESGNGDPETGSRPVPKID